VREKLIHKNVQNSATQGVSFVGRCRHRRKAMCT